MYKYVAILIVFVSCTSQQDKDIISLYNQNKYEELIEYTDQMLAEENNSHVLYCFRGNSFLFTGKRTEAITTYKEGIKYYPKSTILYNQLGYVYGRSLLDFNNAIKYLTKSVEIEPTLSALINRGGLYKDFGYPKKAIDDFMAAIPLLKNKNQNEEILEQILTTIFILYLENNDIENAISYYRYIKETNSEYYNEEIENIIENTK